MVVYSMHGNCGKDRCAIVTGATGFIGRNLRPRLESEGFRVVACRRPVDGGAARSHGALATIDVDLTDRDSVERHWRDLEPEIVFHLAGYGVDRSERDPALFDAVNFEALRNVACATAAVAGAKPGILIHAGTALEYGRARGTLCESTPPEPFEDYGRSKLRATEWLARESAAMGLRAITARIFTVYGAFEHAGRLLPTLLEARRTTEPVRLSPGTQKRDFTFVGDVVEGLLRLADCAAPPGDVVNLATGTLTTVREFVERAAAVLGIAPDRLDFGATAARPEEMHHDPVAIGRLRDLIGWVPRTTIEDGVLRTLETIERTARGR